MEQIAGENVNQDRNENKMESMNKTIDDVNNASITDSPFRSYDISDVAYFAIGPANMIKVVDVTTHEIVDILPASNNPHGIAITPDGKYIFTTSTKMGPNEMLMEPNDESGDKKNGYENDDESRFK